MAPAVILHVSAGGIGILSGATALLAAKGGSLHRLSGTVFFVSMLIMSVVATYLAFTHGQHGNVIGGTFTFYLVPSAWMTVRRPPKQTGAFEIAAMLLGFAVAALGVSFGLRAQAIPSEADEAPMLFVFAALAAFAASLDATVILRGGLAGVARIARHVWRMCAGLFIATGSFFLGQQKVMPAYMHGSPVLFVLALAPLAFMLFWLVRIRVSRRFQGAPATQAALL